MSFGQELKDFVSAFGKGYDMVESADEKEARRAQTRLQNAQSSNLELEASPDQVALRNRGAEAAIGYSTAQTAKTEADTARLTDPALRDADLAGSSAATRLNNANAAATEAQTAEKARLDQAIRDGVRTRFGIELPGAPAAEQAIPTGGVATDGEPTSSAVILDVSKLSARDRQILDDITSSGIKNEADLNKAFINGGPATDWLKERGIDPASLFPATTPAASGSGSSRSKYTPTAEDTQAIRDVASVLGVSPTDLTALMSYETIGTMNPGIVGGTGNGYKGLIQMGKDEREAYGWKDDQTFSEQVRGPVLNYLRARGVKPGMGIGELYSIVNAGSLNSAGEPRWNASDGNGTVRTHVDDIVAYHLPKAEQWLALSGESRPSEGQDAIGIMMGLAKSGNEAVKQGLLYMVSSLDYGFGQDQGVPTPEGEQQQRAFLEGHGAAEAEDVEAAQDIVKQQSGGREMSPAEMNLAVLAVTYDVYMQMGKPEEAQKVAASILQFYRKASSQYATVAQAAAEAGDEKGAVAAAQKAYNNIPDGNEVEVTKSGDEYTIETIDLETGQRVSKVIMSPDELFGQIMQVNPMNFESYILGAAGQPGRATTSAAYQAAVGGPQQGGAPIAPAMGGAQHGPTANQQAQAITPPGNAALPPANYADMTLEEAPQARLIREAQQKELDGPAAPDPLSISDRGEVTTQIDTAWGVVTEALGIAMPAEEAGNVMELQAVASSIYTNPQNNITAEDAVKAVLSMTSVNPEQPGALSFQAKPVEGGVGVRFQNGLQIVVSPQEFDRLAMIRGAHTSTARGSQTTSRERSARDQALVTRMGQALPARRPGGAPSSTHPTNAVGGRFPGGALRSPAGRAPVNPAGVQPPPSDVSIAPAQRDSGSRVDESGFPAGETTGYHSGYSWLPEALMSDDFRQGSKGPEVEELQTFLREQGATSNNGEELKVDGNWGPKTQQAVNAFAFKAIQEQLGSDEGTVAQNTQAIPASAPARVPTPPSGISAALSEDIFNISIPALRAKINQMQWMADTEADEGKRAALEAEIANLNSVLEEKIASRGRQKKRGNKKGVAK